MTFLISWLNLNLNMIVSLFLGILIFVCAALISQWQKDFLELIDSFRQFVSGPTQEHGHTLPLVLSLWAACA